MPDQSILSARGILEQSTAADWYAYIYRDSNGDHDGWIYPLWDLNEQEAMTPDGQRVCRWKNATPNEKPKYSWPRGKHNCNYYVLPGLRAAVEAQEEGLLYLASGEPDNLAFRAAGAANVLSWFGENSMPKSIATDLMMLGVRRVECWPDTDTAGQAWARNIRKALKGSSIGFYAYVLPAELGDKGDVNKLYIAKEFDADSFWQELAICDDMQFEDEPEQQPIPEFSGELPPTYLSAVENALGVTGYLHTGWSKAIPCVLKSHEHDTKSPAAAWHGQKHIYSCLKCGVTEMLAIEIGRHMGIDVKDYYPRRVDVTKPLPPKSTVDNSDDDFMGEVNAAQAQALAWFHDPRDIRGLETGFHALDLSTAGGEFGYRFDLIMPTGSGKTTIFIQWLLNFIKQALVMDANVLIVPTEMPIRVLIHRMACQIAKVNYKDVRRGVAYSAELNDAYSQIARMGLKRLKGVSPSIEAIKERSDSLMQSGKPLILGVDSGSNLGGVGEGIYDVTRTASKGLLEIAAAGAFVFSTWQSKPDGNSAKGAIDVEQDGAYSIYVDDPWYFYNRGMTKTIPECMPGLVTVNGRKNRDGEPFQHEAIFKPGHGLFAVKKDPVYLPDYSRRAN